MVLGRSCRLGPPVVVGKAPDRCGLIEQLYATLHQRLFDLFDLFDLLEDPIGQRASLVNGHNLSAGINSGEPDGKNSRCIPSGTSTSPPVCQPALSTTKRMRLSLPAPTPSANSPNAIENSSVFTVGRIIQKTSPLSGRTKP